MKPLLLAPLVLGIALLGCGGSTSPNAANVFAGQYTGTWTSSNGDVGTSDLSITSSGRVTGSIDDTTANFDGTISGAITDAGVFNETITYSTRTSTGSGTLTRTDTGLAGTVTETSQGHTATNQFTYTTQ